MKTLQEYIYEVSDELLDRAAKAAQAKANDKSLSKFERKVRKQQARDFEAYKNSYDREVIYREYNKKENFKKLVNKGIQPTELYELKSIIELAFKNNVTDLNFIDTSKITNMSNLFYFCENLNYGERSEVKTTFDISKWDVSNVTDMVCMFNGCKQFNCDLSKWNVSNVTDMSWMFYNCNNFNCDLSKWDVSEVKRMSEMFYNCKKFNCDLNKWDVSNVKDMYGAFNNSGLEGNEPDWYLNAENK